MSAPLTIDQYLAAIAPALATDANKAVYIEMAAERTNKCFYGGKYNQAVALLAAHIAFLLNAQAGAMGAGSGSADAGSVGTITSKREGDLSVSYGAGAVSVSDAGVSDAELAQTRFGLMLLALRKGCRPFMGVINGGRGCGRC